MHEFLLIGVIALVTVITRVLPFLLFENKTNRYVEYLGDVLPFSIMAMLVVYCLKNTNFISGYHGICEVIGVISVVGFHLWKRNTLLSIIGGTMVYMLCVQVLFI